MKKRMLLAAVQIMLLVSMSFAFSYILRENSGSFGEFNYGEKSADFIDTEKIPFAQTPDFSSQESKLNFRGAQELQTCSGLQSGVLDIYRKIVKAVWNEKTLALALSADDGVVSTCLLSKSGSNCAEYLTNECDLKCTDKCIPSLMKDVAECRLGTCYNAKDGTCALNSPKSLCESKNGSWYDEPYGNIAQCRLGCCILGGQSSLKNERQCARESELLGTEKIFRTDVRDELSCLMLSKKSVEGACLYGVDENGKNQCKFTTKEECDYIRGNFKEKALCSNHALNTSCERQKTTACFQNKDEVYWVDSCGNRENIYSASKGESWNNGFVKAKDESCKVGLGNSPLKNAKTCGNCNYLLGSICGRAKSGEVSIGDFVCKDLNCIDENGEKRKNGESWCSYQGSVGVDENRATDTVGSRHYRSTCIRGEVNVEPCADYRNEICVESKTDVANGQKLSTAACTINRWQECIHYNSKDELKKLCTLNPDCFVKNISVDKNFKFSLCMPKYSPGFQLIEGERGEGAEMICSYASQKCTKILVKGIGGWSCKANCNCDKDKFAEQMNDFCVSLGDCGMKANYLGTTTDNYKISINKKPVKPGKSPELSDAYRGAFVRYADEEEFLDKEASPGTPEQLNAILGIPGWLGMAQSPNDPTAKTISSLQLPIGAAGLIASLATTSTGISLLSLIPGATLTLQGPTLAGPPLAPTLSPTLSAFTGALSGAAAGFAVVSMLLSFTGVGRGIPAEMSYALMAAGAVAGAVIGAAAMGTSTGTGLLASLGATTSAITGAGSAGLSAMPGMLTAAAVAWVVIVVVVILIIVMFALGIGKVKKINVEFKCLPWQPPIGGNECSKCGSDGKPCSKYACSSLGQTCELINEMSDSPECIETGKDDVSPPIINPLIGNISAGYDYEQISENGFRISKDGSCLEAGTSFFFALGLNEPGRCNFETNHTNKFEEMSGQFGASSLFRREHLRIERVPTLDELGYSQYNRGNKADYSMYVRCQDKRGNENAAEYVVSYCIQKNIDVSEPVIVGKWPVTDKVAYIQQSQNVALFTNEPAECKWDSIDREYELMTNQMNCENDINDETINGWKCFGEFPIRADENKYYVRCKDQPFLADKNVTLVNLHLPVGTEVSDESYLKRIKNENMTYDIKGNLIILKYQDEVNWGQVEGVKSFYGYDRQTIEILNETIISDIVEDGTNLLQERNVMQKSYTLLLSRTIEPLKIDKIEPDGQTLIFGIEPASVRVKVYTSGGYDGTAKCYYKFGEGYIVFLDTLSSISVQDFRTIYSGNTTLNVMCEDEIGNAAEKSASFLVKIDSAPPKVTRIYSNGNVLNLITDENAKCVYGFGGCNYEFSNGTSINGDGKEHAFSIEKGKEYYVKCKDEFGNNPGSLCSVIVRRDL